MNTQPKKYAVVRPNKTGWVWYNFILKENKDGSWEGISFIEEGEVRKCDLIKEFPFENVFSYKSRDELVILNDYDVIFLTEKELIEKYFNQLI
jgi:hypothetical protein